MRLIINADDYGLTKGVSKAIRDLLKDGTIRSTTVMINFVTEEDLKALAKIKNISVGLHFVLDAGKACLVSELTDADGKFKYKVKELGHIPKATIRKELESQYLKLAKYINVTHIDSHHHTHLRNQNVLEAVREFANAHEIKYREAANLFTTDSIKNGSRGFINDFYDDGLELYPERLKDYNEFEQYEMMCHPGYNDEDLQNVSSYTWQREYEIKKLKELSKVKKEKYE